MSYKKLPWKTSITEDDVTLNNGTTNVTSKKCFWYVDDWGYMHVDGNAVFSGAHGAGAILTVEVPGGYQIDTDRLPGGTSTANADNSVLGLMDQWIQGAGWKAGGWFALYATATTVRFRDTSGFLVDSSTASGDGIKFILKIPVR